MSAAERGAYIDLLAFEWNEGGLPTDEASLFAMSGLPVPTSGERTLKVPAKVRSCFIERGGKLINPKLQKLRAERTEFLKKCSVAGQKSAKVKRDKELGGEGRGVGESDVPTLDVGSENQGGGVGDTDIALALASSPLTTSKEKEIQKKKVPKEIHQTALKQAQYLADMIRSKRKQNITPQQITAWAKEIQILAEKNIGIDADDPDGEDKVYLRIDAVLEWLSRQPAGEYAFVIHSGKKLRDKFFDIDAKMENQAAGDRPAPRTPEPVREEDQGTQLVHDPHAPGGSER